MTNDAVGGHPAFGGRKGSTWIVAAVVGAVLQLIVGFFTVTAIGLIALPVWASVVLVGGWLAAAALLVRTVRHSPLIAIVVPVANGLALWGLIAVGGAWLGWTA